MPAPPGDVAPPPSTKRRAAPEHDLPISPPPLKRKAQPSISKDAVASFFTPTSQKPKDQTRWFERAPDGNTLATLLVGRYEPQKTNHEDGEPDVKRRKIAAFDFDSTLVATASGKKHSDDAADWKWWDRCVPSRLRDLYHKDGYQIVVLSNQGGIALHPDPNSKGPKNLSKNRLASFKQKVSAVLSQLDLPVTLYAATGNDIFRKPRTGMWNEMCDGYGLCPTDIDFQHSLFVGDAGGRTTHVSNGKATAKDFSCSDRNLAHNVGVSFYTPEEFFLGEKPRDFVRDFDLVDHPYADGDGDLDEGRVASFEKTNGKDLVLFCGPPGSGKSTFYWKHLKPLGYERVNQDILKSKDKCFKAANEYLQQGVSVAIDNTNADPDTRAQWVELANKNKVPVRCVWFKTPLALCQHNDTVRSLNKPMNPEARSSLPKLAFNGFASRFKEPKVKEGFQDVVLVEFKFRGTRAEYEIWGKYWN